MKKVSIALLFLCTYYSYAQSIQKTVSSNLLQQTREVQIHLPPDYKDNPEKTYPLILVLDADYLFAPVVGNAHYYAYKDKMPASIIVGINQEKYRKTDIEYGLATSFPTRKSAAFYSFIKQEVLPHIQSNYRVSDFSVIVGDGRTANFINYFLLKDLVLFDAYINLSPDYAPNMENMISKRLVSATSKTWYYVGSGVNDFPDIKKSVAYLKTKLDAFPNEKLFINIESFKGNDHLSTVAYAIPSAFEKIFLTYGPILPLEYKNKVLKAASYVAYLKQKYANISTYYNLEIPVRQNDIMAIYTAIEKNKKWEELQTLAKIAGKNYPESMYEDFFMGRFFETTGAPKKALNSYQRAYLKKDISFVTKDLVWKKLNQLKADFGY